MASRHVFPLCCSSDASGSRLLSVLRSKLSPLLSPFNRTTSQWLLGGDSVVSPGARGAPASASASASASACVSASGFAAASRFSLLLDSQCLPLRLARRKRAALRPPLLLLGLPDGLLVRLSEGADFLLVAGEAVGETTKFSPLPLRLCDCVTQITGETEKTENNKRVFLSTFRQVVEAGRGRDGGQVVFSDPQQVLALAAGVEAVLSQVSGSQEGTGVKVLPREFDNLLGFDPATVHQLEALQVDNLKSGARGWFRCRFYTLAPNHSRTPRKLRETDQNRRQPPEVQLLGG